MGALQPWYDVVYPREDLREGRPLDTLEFDIGINDDVHSLASPCELPR